MRRHIPKEHKEMALRMSQKNVSDKKIRRYTGISERSLRYLRKTYRETGEVVVRKRYIATHLLQTLKSHSLFQDVTVVGLVSSHPAACNALAKYASKFKFSMATRC